MTPDIEGLKAIAERATAGPWRVDGDFLVTDDPVEREYERRALADLRYFHMPRDRDNAEFIATFDPPTVLSLLAEVERLTKIERAARLVKFSAYPSHGSGFHNENFLVCRAERSDELQVALASKDTPS